MDPIFMAISDFNNLKAEFLTNEMGTACDAMCTAWVAVEQTKPTTLAGFAAKLQALADEDLSALGDDIVQRLAADFAGLM
jgi:hypothetical protein